MGQNFVTNFRQNVAIVRIRQAKSTLGSLGRRFTPASESRRSFRKLSSRAGGRFDSTLARLFLRNWSRLVTPLCRWNEPHGRCDDCGQSAYARPQKATKLHGREPAEHRHFVISGRLEVGEHERRELSDRLENAPRRPFEVSNRLQNTKQGRGTLSKRSESLARRRFVFSERLENAKQRRGALSNRSESLARRHFVFSERLENAKRRRGTLSIRSEKTKRRCRTRFELCR